MKSPQPKRLIQELLDHVGVQIDGQAPWDIQVHNPDFYSRVIAGGSLALGESYMDGWWDCEALDQFFERILAARFDKKVRKSITLLMAAAKARLTAMHGRARAFEVGRRHYDIGNDLFTVMLDKRMNYSCAYWQEADTLDEAQEAKLELTCRKLELEPDMRVLDIGCGWGSFAIYAAEKYRVKVTGVTVSAEQVKLGQSCCTDLPVRFELKDYRDIQETFDRIVSIGMFEHVGFTHYRTYMQVVNRCLKDDGLFLLHTIGSNTSVHSVDPWYAKYIFPNSMLPSARQISEASEGIFILEDWHSFGPHYDPTLMAWHRNFIDNWHRIQDAYDARFKRMWAYYLLSSAGSFRARRNQLWQIVFSKNGGSENTCQDLNHISPTHRFR
jgi:cyclopropane-fatty-acyl-phospholipid synthase